MNNQTSKIAIIAAIALVVGGLGGYAIKSKAIDAATSSGPAHSDMHDSATSDKSLDLYQTMRKLWADHVIWTREYVISAVDNRPDTNQAADRLMKNQEDIGAAIVPYYGQAAGDRLTTLLKEHITIAVNLIAAAKTSDTAKFDQADQQWDKNAKDIAVFLASTNPNWPEQDLAESMSMHLKTTTDEAVARLQKDYVKDVEAFDAVFNHIMGMSDTLTAGIIKQFPEKF